MDGIMIISKNKIKKVYSAPNIKELAKIVDQTKGKKDVLRGDGPGQAYSHS